MASLYVLTITAYSYYLLRCILTVYQVDETRCHRLAVEFWSDSGYDVVSTTATDNRAVTSLALATSNTLRSGGCNITISRDLDAPTRKAALTPAAEVAELVEELLAKLVAAEAKTKEAAPTPAEEVMEARKKEEAADVKNLAARAAPKPAAPYLEELKYCLGHMDDSDSEFTRNPTWLATCFSAAKEAVENSKSFLIDQKQTTRCATRGGDTSKRKRAAVGKLEPGKDLAANFECTLVPLAGLFNAWYLHQATPLELHKAPPGTGVLFPESRSAGGPVNGGCISTQNRKLYVFICAEDGSKLKKCMQHDLGGHVGQQGHNPMHYSLLTLTTHCLLLAIHYSLLTLTAYYRLPVGSMQQAVCSV